MFALVVNGIILQIFDEDPMLADGLEVIDISGFRDALPGWIVATDGSVTAPLQAGVSKSDLKAYAQGKRFEIETGGYVHNGHLVATDRDSQGKIGNSALAATIIGELFTTPWKGSDGVFFPVDHDEMISMATAIMVFISSCFAAEQAVCSAIDAGTVRSIADIEAASWPAHA